MLAFPSTDSFPAIPPTKEQFAAVTVPDTDTFEIGFFASPHRMPTFSLNPVAVTHAFSKRRSLTVPSSTEKKPTLLSSELSVMFLMAKPPPFSDPVKPEMGVHACPARSISFSRMKESAEPFSFRRSNTF